jgi:nitrite reductase/ring-hydroxylating ferredoxin subunit
MSDGRVRVDDLAAGRCRRFPYTDDLGLTEEAFVLRLDDSYEVFVNRCPHWRIPLDGTDGDFFDRRRGELVCGRHGARFDPRSGACTGGPAEGALRKLPFIVEDGVLRVIPAEQEWLDE